MNITGKVVTKIFYNETNGYTVMIVKLDSLTSVTAVGETHNIDVGDEVSLTGNYDTHKSYGEQFKFSLCIKIMPKDDVSLIQYIADNVKGIGKKTAQNIVNTFKDETKDIIRYHKDKLLEVHSMNEEKAERLHNFFVDEWEKWNSVEYLSSFGISMLAASKIYDSLKQDTISLIKKDPYCLVNYVRTIDFKTIDKIGKSQGISLSNISRIKAGILYFLKVVTQFGHTCVDKDKFVIYATENLEVSEDVVIDGIVALKMEEEIYIATIDESEYIFRKALYLAEKNIAQHVAFHTKQIMPKINYKSKLNKLSKNIGIVLSKKQEEATIMALENSISIITGGPGTGKTTIIRCIIEVLTSMKKSYVLTAPTGRAAKRISETTLKEAKTLHRLLEISKIDDNDYDTFLNYQVKTIDAEFVIVDEVSMIDTLMMNNLFKAIKPTTQVVFVGDVNQLPSVGPGNVLKDIIDSSVVKTTVLTEIYRQSKESDIVINAHKVNSGIYPEFKSNDTDLYFINAGSMDDVVEEISSLVSYRLQNFANIDPVYDLEVITPTKKTDLGTVSLNKLLQNILNKEDGCKNFHEFGSNILREGDKVMQVVNNYDREFELGLEFRMWHI